MPNLRRIITFLMWPMALLLPFWITFGRAFFGSTGWLAVISIFTDAPVLFVSLIVINIIIHFNSTFRFEHLVTLPQAIVLALLYCCVFLFGIFVVDGGDTPESVGSVATRFLGSGFENISAHLGGMFYVASFVLLLAAFVVALGGRFTWVRSWKVWSVIVALLLVAGGTATVSHIRYINDPKVKDEQISYDFQLMRQDITRLARNNGGVLPSGSAKQIAEIGEYGKEFNIAERAGAYSYIPLQEKRQFKLCATFETDTMNEYFATEDSSTNENFHRAGYQCFTFNIL